MFSLALNTMFGDYWKVLDFDFLEVGNTVFFWSKKLLERWYLLDVFVLSMIIQDLENVDFDSVLIVFHWVCH